MTMTEIEKLLLEEAPIEWRHVKTIEGRILETRGGIRLIEIPGEDLPYAVISSKKCLALTADRVCAGWLLDCLEGAESELIRE